MIIFCKNEHFLKTVQTSEGVAINGLKYCLFMLLYGYSNWFRNSKQITDTDSDIAI